MARGQRSVIYSCLQPVADADLVQMAGEVLILRVHPKPGPVDVRLQGDQRPGQEVSPDKLTVRAPSVGSAAGPERDAIVHADRRSVGKLTASNTRRVKLGAKCQCSGKESVASSQAPSFGQASARLKGLTKDRIRRIGPRTIVGGPFHVLGPVWLPGLIIYGVSCGNPFRITHPFHRSRKYECSEVV